MATTIEKLQKLQLSVGKLETVLQEVWNCMDEVGDDDEFRELMEKAEQYKSQGQTIDESLEDLSEKISEFDNYLGQIPEDGTAAGSLEYAISELIDWIKQNK